MHTGSGHCCAAAREQWPVAKTESVGCAGAEEEEQGPGKLVLVGHAHDAEVPGKKKSTLATPSERHLHVYRDLGHEFVHADPAKLNPAFCKARGPQYRALPTMMTLTTVLQEHQLEETAIGYPVITLASPVVVANPSCCKRGISCKVIEGDGSTIFQGDHGIVHDHQRHDYPRRPSSTECLTAIDGMS